MLSKLFQVDYDYTDALTRLRAQILLRFSITASLVGVVVGIPLKLVFRNEVGPIIELVAGLLIATAILYVLVQRGYLRLAAGLFVLAVIIISIFGNLTSGIRSGIALLSFGVAVVIGALLLEPTEGSVTLVLSLLGIAALAWVEYPRRATGPLTPVDIRTARQLTASLVMAEAFLGVLAFLGRSFAGAMRGWAADAERSARQLEATAAISAITATAASLQEMLNPVIERIREAFGFYHAQVFLVDRAQGQAILRASTGRAGEALLARSHMLAVGSRSVVGQCTYLGQPIVVNDVSQSGTHRPNPLLPDTQGELAVPLLVGSEIIGALDVQSTEVGAFHPDDVRTLEIVAGHLATAIEKTRLVSEFGTLAEERRTLLEDTQANLRQIEELNRRLTREGWRDYLRARRERGAMGYTIFGGNVERDTSWTAAMRQAYQGERSVVITKEQQAHIAAVPIRVRGEVIGVVEFECGGERHWTDDDLDLAQALTDRLAMALDNARLFEQAYMTAHREQLLGEITQSVQMSESVEDLLQAALSELGRALGASRGVVQISPKREKEREEE